MEVGQILGHTFSNVSKIHDPSPLLSAKWNRGKYDTQTEWSHMTQEILNKILM